MTDYVRIILVIGLMACIHGNGLAGLGAEHHSGRPLRTVAPALPEAPPLDPDGLLSELQDSALSPHHPARPSIRRYVGSSNLAGHPHPNRRSS